MNTTHKNITLVVSLCNHIALYGIGEIMEKTVLNQIQTYCLWLKTTVNKKLLELNLTVIKLIINQFTSLLVPSNGTLLNCTFTTKE